jgi:glycosyltransferase involved in cell wall biosynthesis
MSASVRVLHVVPSFAPAFRYGGPIVSVLELSRAASAAGAKIDVATTNADGPEDLAVPTDRWVQLDRLRVRYFRRWPRVGYAFSTDLARFLSAHVKDYDVVHVTSTFSFPALAAGRAARAAGIPYIVSPRGSLQGWSLAQKRWKKFPYWVALEKPHLARAAAIHATAEIEERDVKALLPGARVVLVPNGVEVALPPTLPRRPHTIVFLGRIHKKKGFDVLVPALSEVERQMPGTQTIVAGPDNDGEWARVEAMVRASSPKPHVRYVGPLQGRAKFELLASATAFVLPSHSENFGMAVVEALACGTPVVVSRNCPWRSVEDAGAGYWVENTPVECARALLKILGNPHAAERMGDAGRRLASQFQWPEIGRHMARTYEELARRDASRVSHE